MELNLSYTEAQMEIFFPSKEYKYTFVPKGRRLGATKGAAFAVIEWLCDGITPVLWVDTINGNIDRYFERYMQPVLTASKIPFNWNKQKKELKVFNSVLDFRSSDQPENIEGFGYKKIILNEAGIILKDNYLYTNAILPMMLDYPESQLYALGTPKGKFNKDGSDHLYYKLCEKAMHDPDGMSRVLKYSTYDNPTLSLGLIKELENEIALIDARQIPQEIHGEFIELTGENPFMTQYDTIRHQAEVEWQPDKQLLIIIDFNINPFAANFAHVWKDTTGFHFHIFDEADIQNGSIPTMAEHIKTKYMRVLNNAIITGDYTGSRRDISQIDNASYFEQLRRALGLRDNQVKLVPNPTHSNSRADCNYILYHFPDVKINPKTCKGLARDMKIVQCNAYGEILKSNRSKVAQQADHFDNFRTAVNVFLSDWISKHQKGFYTEKTLPLQRTNNNSNLQAIKNMIR